MFVNQQLLAVIIALFAVLGFIGDGSPPDLQERAQHATTIQ